MDTSNLNIPRELISETKSFDIQTPVTEIVSSISRYSAVVVTKGPRYYGIVDNRALYRFAENSGIGKDHAGKYALAVPAVESSTSIDEVLLSFHKSRAKALPYLSGGRVSGIIKRSTLLKVLLSLRMLSGMNANDTMTSPVVAVDSNATLAQARSAMRERRISRLVILQGGRLSGIITNHDLMVNYSRKGDRLPEMKNTSYSPSDAQLGSAASRNLITIDYTGSLADAARKMVENSVSSVIVVRRGAPVGIVTILDIFGSVLSARRMEDQRIFLSGLEGDMHEYEADAKESLKDFMKKAEQMLKAKALAVFLNVKKVGNRKYEMRARLSIEGQGTIYVHSTDFNMERTLGKLLATLMKEIKKMKEKRLTVRKVSTFKKGMDEAEYYDELA